VEMVGVCTSICIMFTAVSLLDREIHCRVYRDGVADFDPRAHAFALEHLQCFLFSVFCQKENIAAGFSLR
jgi:nicotinamidase/pyrazinamidase